MYQARLLLRFRMHEMQIQEPKSSASHRSTGATIPSLNRCAKWMSLSSSTHIACVARSHDLNVIHEGTSHCSTQVSDATKTDGFAAESTSRPCAFLVTGQYLSTAVDASQTCLPFVDQSLAFWREPPGHRSKGNLPTALARSAEVKTPIG